MNQIYSNCPVRVIKLSFPRGSNELGCSKQLNTRFLSKCQMCSPAIITSVVHFHRLSNKQSNLAKMHLIQKVQDAGSHQFEPTLLVLPPSRLLLF
jgi:hypothetical protein